MTHTYRQTKRWLRARKDLRSLTSFIRRETTGWTDRSAEYAYQRALRSVLAVEDIDGVYAAAPLSDRLRTLRWEAERIHLLTPEEIFAAEEAGAQRRY